MKKALLPFLGILALTAQSQAASSVITYFGIANDSAGAPVANNTLWIMVVDGGDSILPGGLNTGVGITDSLISSSGAEINGSFQIGQSLTMATQWGTDKIAAWGSLSDGLLDGQIDVAGSFSSGLSYAIYYFPGVVYTGASSYNIGSQVGAVFSGITDADGNLNPMFMPGDGNTSLTQGAASVAGGGSIVNSQFNAVTLVPEPSVALLGGVGLLALLRRRRD